jgi:hypothetical protein
MRALEEVALSYEEKAAEAAKTDELQKQLDTAELRSDKLSNVFILHVLFFILRLIPLVYKSNNRQNWAKLRDRIGNALRFKQ